MRILHIGCGNQELPSPMKGEEVRLDIDPNMNPDVCASMIDMGDIGTFGVTYCCHALEHLYPHEVNKALKEFHRVLDDGGSAIIFVPDLEGLTPTEDILYESSGGPITAMDLFYGYRKALETQPHMAHHTGFTSESLKAALLEVGFEEVTTKRLTAHNLFAIAKKGTKCSSE